MTTQTARAHPITETLAEAFSLSCAATFAIWSIGTDAADLRQLESALSTWLRAWPAGAVAGGAVAAAARFHPLAHRWAVALIVASMTLYVGALKVLDLAWLPWVLLGAAGLMTVAIVYGRRGAAHDGVLPMLHAMGTMTGLYLAVHLSAFTSAWSPFQAVVGSLWRLLAG